MWSVIRPAALQAARVNGTTGSLAARRGLACLSARVVLNRSASCAYRLTVVARSMATAAAKAKTARKPAASAKKPTAAKAKGRAAGATKTTKATKSAKTTKPSRTVKAKSKAAKPKKARAKKALTPEQKLASEKRTLAKKTLAEPLQLPDRSWLVYLSQKTKGKPYNLARDTAALSKSFKELSAAELENLKEIARANAVANQAAYKAWVESHTPEEVHAANLARARLRRVHKVSVPRIKDSRLPKRTMSPFFFYLQKGIAPRDPAQESVTEHAKSAGAQWKSLSADQRKPFMDMSAADKARYEKDKKSIGLS